MSPRALPTDLHWADLHVRTLCKHDAAGRLVSWNEPGRDDAAAPLFFFAATLHGNLWRFHEGLAPEAIRELSRLAAAERTQPELSRDPERLPSFEEHLRRPGSTVRLWRGFAFRFPEAMPSFKASLLAESLHSELGEAFPELIGSTAERMPCFVHREGSKIVSACYSATDSATASERADAVEAGVETLSSHRDQGFASDAVAAWAREIQNQGTIPLFSTSRENRSSRSVARKLGLELYAATLHFSESTA